MVRRPVDVAEDDERPRRTSKPKRPASRAATDPTASASTDTPDQPTTEVSTGIDVREGSQARTDGSGDVGGNPGAETAGNSGGQQSTSQYGPPPTVEPIGDDTPPGGNTPTQADTHVNTQPPTDVAPPPRPPELDDLLNHVAAQIGTQLRTDPAAFLAGQAHHSPDTSASAPMSKSERIRLDHRLGAAAGKLAADLEAVQESGQAWRRECAQALAQGYGHQRARGLAQMRDLPDEYLPENASG